MHILHVWDQAGVAYTLAMYQLDLEDVFLLEQALKDQGWTQ